MKVSELERGTTPIGARVNAHFISLLKEASIPISSVVESVIGYFLTLPDEEKEKMLCLYHPQNIEVGQIQHAKRIWSLENKYNNAGIESVREILMSAEEDDLTVLSGYCIEINKKTLSDCDDTTMRYVWVNNLILNFQAVAKNFFYAKMDYRELLFCIAGDLEINIDRKMEMQNDLLEMIIAKQYIIKCLAYMSDQQKIELAQILGLQEREDQNFIEMLSEELQESVNYRLISWLANANAQSFVGETAFWDSTSGEVFYGRKKFREYIFYPIIHIGMLRRKYRCDQLPKCPACATVIIPGAKFCNECGTKL